MPIYAFYNPSTNKYICFTTWIMDGNEEWSASTEHDLSQDEEDSVFVTPHKYVLENILKKYSENGNMISCGKYDTASFTNPNVARGMLDGYIIKELT